MLAWPGQARLLQVGELLTLAALLPLKPVAFYNQRTDDRPLPLPLWPQVRELFMLAAPPPPPPAVVETPATGCLHPAHEASARALALVIVVASAALARAAAAGMANHMPDSRCGPPSPQGYFASPADYMAWYQRQGPVRDPAAPTVAVLLYRKHVITQQPCEHAATLHCDPA